MKVPKTKPRLLIYVKDYLLQRCLVRTARNTGMIVTEHYRKLPARWKLPTSSEVDLILLHHDQFESTPLQYYDNLYLAELVYPNFPVLMISDLNLETVRGLYSYRSRLLPIDQMRIINHFCQTAMAIL